ncbi:MAG: leucyl aminopeptidase [Ignavibacteria bacterium RIFOXYB2_FULL_35_12]|nr:MAG: leucyl aminopeptidase [Ignavibacteria bacterium GWA2_36_19]OGU59687.1 MAG: leucyl aminopeptidase [Ignavibacteria bacterium GWF2_35_20]OGU82832.1 MAG: leucyl aminopeptidase [Ignavibacteria bacterium RIFOXYA2_FULL_35_9]OGU85155.1 MAG: leucyl aminopeptidase [Ignavibacteria bacterium RIFOXYA12_FULL_35_25]OGU91834.1 MAG: leucyl aminopeptidase [Ignavibacteria bacterium RIFOXYC12_FULL_35_11]OGU97491.1 MAG: leucyl aminopeptidase [Ignavibacteria bacterium RIFOXYB12_FULL_35_14]OGV01216.1 MAG: l
MALSKLDSACIIAIKTCMCTKKDEKVLVITDEQKREIGYALYSNALRLGHQSLYVEMKSGKINGEEPPEAVGELMQKFDVVLCPTAKSLTHTNARRAASAKGVRVATFPGITKDVMIRGMNADYNKISKLSIKLKDILEKGSHVRITSALGTDISFSIKGRTSYASKGLFHAKGESGNLPTGETFLAPVEGTSNGIFIVDGSMAGLGLIKNVNITIKVKDGYATEIKGGILAKKLSKQLDDVGRDARNIAEFGIGTNDSAKLSGVLLEDEKVMGTVHIALGNNVSMGGSVNVPIHLDGVIKKPTVYLDGQILMKNGKLLDWIYNY